MSESIQWKGYLLSVSNDSLYIQSPFLSNDAPVYGPDSDATTMGVAGIQYLQSIGATFSSIHLPESVDAFVVYVATGVDSPLRNEDLDFDSVHWHVIEGEHAGMVISQSDSEHFEFTEPLGVSSLDDSFLSEMEAAWDAECSHLHVSQGAYVSQSQYSEGSSARLTLAAQAFGGTTVWPPRQLDASGARLPSPNGQLDAKATVESWTKLSAAGAPSEFSLRAPILGGIQTLLVRFKEGPRGVFLVCDDVEYAPAIGDSVQFAVRRIYAQEGFIRYGLKALPLTETSVQNETPKA